MGWIHDEIHRAVGLPRELGGIPLDEVGATGFGLAAAVEVACDAINLDLKGARVAVQGFGAVGKHTARFLSQKGCVLVACSGLDVSALSSLKNTSQAVTDFPRGDKANTDAIIDAPCDIWIPAAWPDVLNGTNAGRLKARIVAQGLTYRVRRRQRRSWSPAASWFCPTFVVNAGGVICAAAEYHGGSESAAFEAIDEKIRKNTSMVIETSRRAGISARAAAIELATNRIRSAERSRRWR